jgi:hypothetical protein
MYCHVYEYDPWRGFRLAFGFIDHLYTRLGTTSNYSTTANLHNSQITTAPAKPFPAFCVFSNHYLVTAYNCGGSSASALKFFLNGDFPSKCPFSSQPPVQNWLGCRVVFLVTPRHDPRRQHIFHSRMRIRCRGNVFTKPFPSRGHLFLSRICCLTTDVVPLFRGCCLETNAISEPFTNKGCFSGSTVLALSKYATTFWHSCWNSRHTAGQWHNKQWRNNGTWNTMSA